MPQGLSNFSANTLQYSPEFAFHKLAPCHELFPNDKVERELLLIKRWLALA